MRYVSQWEEVYVSVNHNFFYRAPFSFCFFFIYVYHYINTHSSCDPCTKNERNRKTKKNETKPKKVTQEKRSKPKQNKKKWKRTNPPPPPPPTPLTEKKERVSSSVFDRSVRSKNRNKKNKQSKETAKTKNKWPGYRFPEARSRARRRGHVYGHFTGGRSREHVASAFLFRFPNVKRGRGAKQVGSRSVARQQVSFSSCPNHGAPRSLRIDPDAIEADRKANRKEPKRNASPRRVG